MTENWNTMAAELWFLERQASWIERHVTDARARVLTLRSRPEFDTLAMSDLQTAKDKLTDLLELIADTQRTFDALPSAQYTLQAAE
jgi:hypothetical protein